MGLGLVGTASAQVPTYNLGSIPQAFMAAEGTTEPVPTVPVVNTNATAATGPVTFTLTANVPFANQLVKSPTYAGEIDATVPTGFQVTSPTATTIQIYAPAGVAAGATITVDNLYMNTSAAPPNTTVTVSLSANGAQVGTPSSAAVGFVTKAVGSVTYLGNGSPTLCSNDPTMFTPISTITASGAYAGAFRGPSGAILLGTTLAVTFTNLNAGVNYYVPATITGGATATATAVISPNSTTPASAATGTGVPANQILVTTAAPTVYYQITAAGTGSQAFSISVLYNVPSVGGVTSFSGAPVNASVVLAGATAPAYPGYSGGYTYTGTLATGGTASAGILSSCYTTLLFPYVVNIAGFDTGISIANASNVPFTGSMGTVKPTNSAGTCSITFYGTGAPTAAYNYGTVAVGTNGTPIDVGTVAPGMSGYAVAQCNFLGAHGYAFVGEFANGNLGANYLAVVVATGANAVPDVAQ